MLIFFIFAASYTVYIWVFIGVSTDIHINGEANQLLASEQINSLSNQIVQCFQVISGKMLTLIFILMETLWNTLCALSYYATIPL